MMMASSLFLRRAKVSFALLRSVSSPPPPCLGGVLRRPLPFNITTPTAPALISAPFFTRHSSFLSFEPLVGDDDCYCFSCLLPERFASMDEFAIHNTCFHPEDKFPFPCPLCGSRFQNPVDLDFHLDTLECMLYGPLKPIDDYSDLSHARETHTKPSTEVKNMTIFATDFVKSLRLYEIITSYPDDQIVVYVNSAARACSLMHLLQEKCRVPSIGLVHHRMTTTEREEAISLLSSRLVRVLITTDLDVPEEATGKVSFIVNYDPYLKLPILYNRVLQFVPTKGVMSLKTIPSPLEEEQEEEEEEEGSQGADDDFYPSFYEEEASFSEEDK